MKLWVVVCVAASLGASAACSGGGSGPPTPGPGGAAGTTGGSRGGRGGSAGVGGSAGSAGSGGAGASPGTAGGGQGGGGAGGGPGAGGATGGSESPPAVDAARDSAAEGPSTVPPARHDCVKLLAASGPTSEWARPGREGEPPLVYKPLTAGGDRIMDFSHAGYGGGGVPLPSPPVVETVGPSGMDDTPAIQRAIDAVAARPATGGFRGAVLLRPGSYLLAGQLRISTSGVVLRGSGSGSGGTELRFTGGARRVMFVTGTGARAMDASAWVITDENLPAGARTFNLDRADGLKVGDDVLVGRPVTQAWISRLGMDMLVRNGAPQTWIRAGTVLRGERQITAIDGNQISIDVPLPDSFEARDVRPPGGSVNKYSFPGRISQVGIERLRAVGSPRAAGNDFHFVELSAVKDGWVRDIVAHDFTSGVVVRDSVSRVTIEDTLISHTPVEYFTAAAPSDFNIDGSQVLIVRGGSRGGNKIFYHSTAGGVVGPNVILGFVGSGMRSHVQPHMRWASGLLVDSTTLDDGNIEYINRGTAGSGHGWAMGWGVIWNSAASTIRAEQPDGSANWAIGNKGTRAGNGLFDSHGMPVVPGSLYLAQLCARLGPGALAALGY